MIYIGRKGRILSGSHAGSFVLIQNDEANTGGYLILLSPDSSFQQGYDDWVEKNALDDYVREANWEIEWLEYEEPH
jgi:hypothetical protein